MEIAILVVVMISTVGVKARSSYKNGVFVELGGNGYWYSINYERQLPRTTTARIGIGSAQEAITADLLYDLTKRTIEDFGKGKVKVVRSVAMPTEFWDTESARAKAGRYLAPEDLGAIAEQVNGPLIETWDVETIRGMPNVRMVNKRRGNKCLLIALPVFSADLKTVVICYQSWDRNAGAGFVVVWKRGPGNAWRMEREEMIWITKVKSHDSGLRSRYRESGSLGIPTPP